MKLARVTGTVEATVKDPGLSGHKLLLTDLIDGSGAVMVPAFVAVDTCGAGVGDQVLVTFNSAARLVAGMATVPTDATIVAVVDRVTLAKTPATKAAGKAAGETAAKPSASRKRKS